MRIAVIAWNIGGNPPSGSALWARGGSRQLTQARGAGLLVDGFDAQMAVICRARWQPWLPAAWRTSADRGQGDQPLAPRS